VPNPVLQRLVDERSQTQENIDRILDRANEEERDPTESERELINGHRERLQQLEPMIGELLEVEETRGKAKDARAALTRRREQPEGEGNGEEGNGGDQPREGEYRTFAQYARDAILTRFAFIGQSVEPAVRQRAAQRLQRAVETVLTTDVPGLIRPEYIAQIMQVIARDRPLVSSARMLPLTSGSIQYPRITARPTVAEQVTQKTEVGVGTMTVAMQTKAAKTFLSSANFSWQTIQWSSPDALSLWFDLCGSDYAKKTDTEVATILDAADTTPTLSVPNTLDGWTDAVADAAGRIYSATGRRANTIYSDVTTGYGILGLVSSATPIFLATGGANLSAGAYPSIGGLQLVISTQIAADRTYVADSSAILCAETAGAPVELRMVEPSIGGLEVGIIGAFACDLVEAGAVEELHTGAT
jgi:HK97 family phage major capsid protein